LTFVKLIMVWYPYKISHFKFDRLVAADVHSLDSSMVIRFSSRIDS
jgi:hypothetical protein